MATDQIIIYDDTCPMCVWYTGVFVKTGLLQPENRRAFSQVDRSALPVDWERSRDEIPLVEIQTGQVRYGIDSMLAVIGQRFPLLAKLAKLPPLRGLARLLYKLVTYNRRAMSGAAIPESARAYGPHFNYFYRYLYLLLVLMSFGGVVSGLDLTVAYQWLIVGIALLPLLPALALPQRRALHYAGVMLTPLVPVGLVLWPAVYWSMLFPYLAILGGLLWLRMTWRRWPVARQAVA